MAKAKKKKRKVKKTHTHKAKRKNTTRKPKKQNVQKDAKTEQVVQQVTEKKEENKDAKKKSKKKQIVKKAKEYKNYIFGFSNKKVSVAVILVAALGALVIQSVLEAKFNPEVVQANISTSQSSANEAFRISSDFDIIETEKRNRGHYIAPGDTDIDVFSIGIRTGENTVILKELTLTKIGETSDSEFLKATLYEGENVISKGLIQRGEVHFRRLTSVLQPNVYKEYIVKLDLSEETKPGSRFKFTIESPHNILLYKDDQPVYSLDTYPIEGAYVTIVGRR